VSLTASYSPYWGPTGTRWSRTVVSSTTSRARTWAGRSCDHLFFTQNLVEVHGDSLRRGEIAVPAGDSETSFVDARDVASVAAAALTESGHDGVAYDLTGPAALTYDEVAAIASEVLGYPVEYTNPSLPGFVVGSLRAGRSLGFTLVMAGIYTTARLGLAGRVTGDVERVLGRPPRDVRAFFEEYRNELQGS